MKQNWVFGQMGTGDLRKEKSQGFLAQKTISIYLAAFNEFPA